VITGVAPNGIGESTALAIASQDPSTLILASRTQKRMEAVAEKIKSKYPNANVKLVVLDLASQDWVRKAAAEIAVIVPKVDVLINNAAIFVMSSRGWTKEKIELQFGVGHIGHFLLTRQLMPLLKAAAAESPTGATRIINLSSQGHRLSPIRFHDYNLEGKDIPPEEEYNPKAPPAFTRKLADGYMPAVAYGQCKTANILFSVSLQKYLKMQGISSYAVHPGSKQHPLHLAIGEYPKS
jgi:NAD(P)-dependent dehydrogenase (short-subunit alcohol dehydrogenase family)